MAALTTEKLNQSSQKSIGAKGSGTADRDDALAGSGPSTERERAPHGATFSTLQETKADTIAGAKAFRLN